MAEKPCCAAEALQRIRQIDVNGIPTGITMLEEDLLIRRRLYQTSEFGR